MIHLIRDFRIIAVVVLRKFRVFTLAFDLPGKLAEQHPKPPQRAYILNI
jgi:hypothetical protein